jgi:hypothetical protein
MRRVLGASVAGASHVRRGLPCQDAFRVVENVIAVADGLGSAAHSELGAVAATEAAVHGAAGHAEYEPARAALEGVVAAREALEKVARAHDYELRDLACTLIVAVYAQRVGLAHVGDGAVVGACGDDVFMLSPPDKAEYINEVVPITSDGWIDSVQTVVCSDAVDAIGLFTDGCQHAAIRRGRAHPGFLGPLFAYARSEAPGDEALADLLNGAKMAEHSDDDKTLVLAVL